MVVRNNRQVTRLFFLLVLAMALFGAWFGTTFWQPDLDTLALSDAAGNENWIDLAASLGEVVLQLFLGVTTSG